MSIFTWLDSERGAFIPGLRAWFPLGLPEQRGPELWGSLALFTVSTLREHEATLVHPQDLFLLG